MEHRRPAPSGRLLRGAFVMALAVPFLVPGLAGVSAAAGACDHVRTSGRWATIDPPTSTSPTASSARFLIVGVDPANPRVIFAGASGTVGESNTGAPEIVRSTDGGCTWQSVFGLLELQAGLENSPSYI